MSKDNMLAKSEEVRKDMENFRAWSDAAPGSFEHQMAKAVLYEHVNELVRISMQVPACTETDDACELIKHAIAAIGTSDRRAS